MPPPRSAYVHVPFCRRRCGYCNFTVVAGRDDLIDSYLDALEIELQSLEHPRPVETLFLGGGTPTHPDSRRLRRLLECVTRWFPLTPGHEFSVEANPSDICVEKAELLASFGVNRLSLGAQSVSSRKLKLLERDHDAADIRRAIAVARDRFASLALDLIFGVPDETLREWHDDLSAALELGVDHVSTYGLTIEKGTSFWARDASGQLSRVPEELDRDLYLLAIDRLESAGFEHYEVSNFARPGHRCRHNEAYWLGHEYYAAGPGAARYVDGRREVNHRSTSTYLRRLFGGQSPVAESERLEAEDMARERLVFGLRRLDGVDLDEFRLTTGYSIDRLIGSRLPRYLEAGLLEWAATRLRLTRAGLLVSDAIWPAFL